jgi:predicted transport protein
MQLFKIDDNKLNEVNQIDFKKEKELQDLINSNLKILFGLDFIKTEFTVDDIRLDGVAFDPNNKAFVIIEYKNDVNFSVIDQGYTYLNMLLDKKADFILLYREVTGKDLQKDNVDWTSTKVIFISPQFTKYQIRAINIDLPFELIEVHKYENNSLIMDRVELKHGKSSNVGSVLKNSVIQKVSREIKLYSEDYHLKQASDSTKNLYFDLKDRILGLGDNIEIKPRKFYIGFISSTNFVDIHFEKSKLKIWVNLKLGQLNDPDHVARDVSKIGHWGNGDYEINFKNAKDVNYLMNLIIQAYNKNS